MRSNRVPAAVPAALLAGWAALGCSAGEARPSETRSSTEPADAGEEIRTPTAPPWRDPAAPSLPLGVRGFDVSSTARGADGAVYLAGTFAGVASFGQASLSSRGPTDAFLVKTEAGAVLWAVSASGPRAESDVAVALDDEHAAVLLLGLTQGDVDCGGGALPDWSSGTFFACLYRQSDGAYLEGATFPTGPGSATLARPMK